MDKVGASKKLYCLYAVCQSEWPLWIKNDYRAVRQLIGVFSKVILAFQHFVTLAHFLDNLL